MQTDPIGYGDGPNWYNYVGGDPVNGTDPSGLDDEEIVVTARKVSQDGGGGIGFGNGAPGGAGPSPGGGGGGSEQEIVITARHKKKAPTVPPVPMTVLPFTTAPFPSIAEPQNDDGPEIVVTAKKNGSCLSHISGASLAGLGADLIGVGASFVPGGKGLLTAGAAVVGSATGVASLGLGVAAHSPVGYGGAAIGVAGHYTSNAAALLEGAKGVASYLPYAGQALAIGGLLYDVGATLSDAGCFGGGE